MSTSAGMARNPYWITVSPRICACRLPPRDLGRFRTATRALAEAEGYWNVYLAFFGQQQIWLQWTVVDARDGMVLWRNGRRTKEGASNGTQETA